MKPEKWANGVVIEHPGQVTPGMARAIRATLDPLVRLCHRPTLTGVEKLPDGPFLLVANHSAGIGLAEINTFMVMYLRAAGEHRPLAGFAHPAGFRLFPLSALWKALGTIPSTYAAAEQTLSTGVPILAFPGGDYETLRPIWHANTVDFGGRLGFLRIARKAGVPIVPLGIRGGHFTAPILWQSRILATLLVVPRLFGLKRWAVSLLGVIVAVLIGAYVPVSWPVRAMLIGLWLGSPLTFFPWVPWTLRMRIGDPIPAGELFAGDGGDEQLRRALVKVEAEIQSLVDP